MSRPYGRDGHGLSYGRGDENDETEDRDDNGDEYVLEFQSDKAEEASSCDDMRIENESFFSYNGTDYRARLYEIPDGKAQDFISKVPRLPYTKWFDYDKIKGVSLIIMILSFIPMFYAILTPVIEMRSHLSHHELFFGNFFIEWNGGMSENHGKWYIE